MDTQSNLLQHLRGYQTLNVGKHYGLLSACYLIRGELNCDDMAGCLYRSEDTIEVVSQFLVFDSKSIASFRRILTKREQESTCNESDAEFTESVLGEGLLSTINLQAAFRRFARRSPTLYRQVLQASLMHIEATLLNQCRAGLDELKTLIQVFNLGAADRQLLEYLICLEKGLFFSIALEAMTYDEPLQQIAAMIGLQTNSSTHLADQCAALHKRGLLVIDDDADDFPSMIKMTDVLRCLLKQPDLSPEALQRKIAPPLPAGRFNEGDFLYIHDEWHDLICTLRGALTTGAVGVNILLYGKPGTCKTELARSVITQLSASGLEVGRQDHSGKPLSARERIASMLAVQTMLGERRDAVLVFDEIEDLFGSGLDDGDDPDMSRQGRISKGWMTEALEQNPMPVIWIANQIQHIDPAYLRRFQYHLMMKTPPAQARSSMIDLHFADLPVSQQLRAELSNTASLTAGDLQCAAQFVRLCMAGGQTGPFDAHVQRQLKQALRAGGRKDILGDPAGHRDYDLRFLNLKMERPIGYLISALERKRQGKLFLYGLPGTGKTCLVEYIAKQLALPVLRYLASDLLGKYVGETEKKIANMFVAANQEPCILFLDEADSFFQSRASAVHSWEVTQVNELLQRSEAFQGLFMCATNLFNNLDPAVLRRFSFKIEFLALTLKQREDLFIRLVLEGDGSLLTNTMQRTLQKMDGLTPGDFHVVRQQNALFDEDMTPQSWLFALEKEFASKQHGKRSIGFH